MTKAIFEFTKNKNYAKLKLKGHFEDVAHCAFFTGSFYMFKKLCGNDVNVSIKTGETIIESKNECGINAVKNLIDYAKHWVEICKKECPIENIEVKLID